MFDNHKNGNYIDFISRRLRMVDEQIVRRGVRDSSVLAAMRTVPRHKFVPERLHDSAYMDGPLPIGNNQTISQPYIVASMTEELNITPESKVLEIGTGSGYQTAVLAEIAREVCTIEIIPSLLSGAGALLHQLGYKNIKTMLGDGSLGWPVESPFDGIIITAAAPKVPDMLIEQLSEGGTMVIPIGDQKYGNQELYHIKKTSEGITRRDLYPVRFVPMVGEVGK